MNFTSQKNGRVVVRQIPMLLLMATAIFSLPFLSYSLVLIVKGIDAEGKWFCLVFGLFMGWLFLEYVATREKIQIDRSTNSLSRVVSGIFRRRRQTVDLSKIDKISVQVRKDWRGRRRDYLYLLGDEQKHLLNTPEKNLNHRATAALLSELTGLPSEVVEGEPVVRASRR